MYFSFYFVGLVVICSGQTIEPPPSVDCRGFIGFVRNPKDACSNHYYKCYEDGTGERLFCDDSDLVFNHRTGKCEEPDNLVECKTFDEPMDCSKGPGNIQNPDEACSSTFVTCLPDGSFIPRECAAAPTTKYDSISDACLLPDFVEACGGKSTTTKKSPPAPQEPVDFDCTRKVDGDYDSPTEPCSQSFFSCSNGHAIARECPQDLRFDLPSGFCLNPAFVEACGGTATEKTTTEVPTLPPTIDFDCKEFGNFPVKEGACAQNFVSCEPSGVALLRECAGDAYYDAELDRCMFYANVPECSGTPRPSTTQRTPPVPTEAPKFDCTGLEDGNYAAAKGDCQPFYYSCTADKPIKHDCQTNLFFDQEYNQCLGYGNIPDCTGEPRRGGRGRRSM